MNNPSLINTGGLVGKTLLTKGKKKKKQYQEMGTSAQVQRYSRRVKNQERKFSDAQVPAKTGS